LGSKPTNTATTGGKTIADLEKEKAMNKLWGPTAAQNQSYGASTQAPKQSGGVFDDLLM
jgi:epsin